jgi:hypothetical protein
VRAKTANEYRLVVDGECLPDLLAEDYVSNPFGGINSVLTISPRSQSGPAQLT